MELLHTKQCGRPFEDLYLVPKYIVSIHRVKDKIRIKMIDNSEYEVTASMPEILNALIPLEEEVVHV